MKIKNIFGGLVLLLAGCVTIGGHIDLSYVPVRKGEGKSHSNEIRTEVDVHAELPIRKSKITIGGANTTYMDVMQIKTLPEVVNGLFTPTTQDYLFYTKFSTEIPRGNLEFYLSHNCKHPINRRYFNNHILLEGETKLGARLEF